MRCSFELPLFLVILVRIIPLLVTMSFLRRSFAFATVVNPNVLSRRYRFCTNASTTILDNENEATRRSVPASDYSDSLHLSPLFSDDKAHSCGYDIELVDHDAWRVSSGLTQAWRGTDGASTRTSFHMEELVDEVVDHSSPPVEADSDFDDIDNMRIRGNLFYKLDRDSKEFEEYSFDFHRRKSSKKKDDQNERKKVEKKDNKSPSSSSRGEIPPKVFNNKCSTSPLDKVDSFYDGKKKLRTPTFNQLTDPYHEPFCLDIYISKASVRACVIHRVTSKVVVVAHSISKDMKFELASTRNATACAAVGSVLAQRALADDIHDVVYTPRKGDRLEGKLQIVLQSIIDTGVNVKVKLKQRRLKKAAPLSTP
ncbi:hypothetical protein I3843_01G157600 [Carya illinoinensis]|uniref:Ribosomal protein L18 n=2 Tax=Carya illinoinensis TaxID=32201 RepID=A0A922G1C0_CARIL|nr:uncharacterized protein LOC122275343 [Carya illinoinensis]KAG6732194.1 hypothetical protein I3842_01G164900 [Carya illinoinensis]KAG7996412.1 hypothetical protein I3843_01G157600 [Carya illinoinensis]